MSGETVDGDVSLSNTAHVADVPIILTGTLNPASDSGRSHFDAITNVSQPNFFGDSEPLSTIQLFATPSGGGPAVPIGHGSADSSGFWSITSTHLADGSYVITAQATDQAGHTKATSQILPNASQGPLVIDTAGPRVTAVTFDRVNGQIDITFQDDRSGLDQAQVIDAANSMLSKLHTRTPGTFKVNVISATPSGATGPEQVVLSINDGRQLRGGIDTLTILSGSGASGIRDVAGNALDGEFYGYFPSGNKLPGGNFVAELDAVHNLIFAPQTVIGNATPVVPPGTPSKGVTSSRRPIPGSAPGTRTSTEARSCSGKRRWVRAPGSRSTARCPDRLPAQP